MTPSLHTDDRGVATIRLNRPQHLNCLHREDLVTLARHFESVHADPALRTLVITGEGRAFCAGFNLNELHGDTDPQLFERVVDALEDLPLPTIARLNGSVYGGATDLALACDFRVGVHGMELRMPAASLGLHYYPHGLRRYITRLGVGAAKRLFLLAEAVGSAELVRLGYLDTCVAAEALDTEVERIAHRLAANAPLAVRGMKQSLDEIARGEMHLSLLEERAALCAASADLREGMAAFAERRAPHFTGE